MKSTRSVLIYTVLRLAVFIVPFVVFMSVGVLGPYAALYAAIIGLVLSLLFLRGSRDRVADVIDQTRHGESTRTADEDIEDSLIEESSVDEDTADTADTADSDIATPAAGASVADDAADQLDSHEASPTTNPRLISGDDPR